MALAAGCSRGDTSWDYAVPHGLYDVHPPTCLSSGVAPRYPSPDFKSALLDFDGLLAHTLQVDATSTVETFTDSDCTLSITRTPHSNETYTFSLRRDRRYVFTPEGCTLSVIHAGAEYAAGRAYSDQFIDSEDRRLELPWVVVPESDGSLTLATEDRPELAELWAGYGCGATDDRLLIRLIPRRNS